MEFSQLRIFQAVAEEGSVTRAAERLHRVPSNLSTRLRQLEEQLGVELFLRERQRLQLSPAGKVLLDYAHRLTSLRDEALAAVQGGQPAGISCWAPCTARQPFICRRCWRATTRPTRR